MFQNPNEGGAVDKKSDVEKEIESERERSLREKEEKERAEREEREAKEREAKEREAREKEAKEKEAKEKETKEGKEKEKGESEKEGDKSKTIESQKSQDLAKKGSTLRKPVGKETKETKETKESKESKEANKKKGWWPFSGSKKETKKKASQKKGDDSIPRSAENALRGWATVDASAFAGPPIIKWLADHHLIKYKDLFIQNGYLEPLFLVACSDEELEELVADAADRSSLIEAISVVKMSIAELHQDEMDDDEPMKSPHGEVKEEKREMKEEKEKDNEQKMRERSDVKRGMSPMRSRSPMTKRMSTDHWNSVSKMPSSSPQPLIDWLETNRLSKYKDILIEKGITEPEMLYDINGQQYFDFGITDMGDRAALLGAVKRYRNQKK